MQTVMEWSVVLYVAGARVRHVLAFARQDDYSVTSYEQDGSVMLGTSHEVPSCDMRDVTERMRALIQEWRGLPQHRVVVQKKIDKAKLC